jgi:hypothetical protein
MTYMHNKIDWCKLAENMSRAGNLSELLTFVRETCTVIPFDVIDFFLYSEDLESFFFPPHTEGMPCEKFREKLTKVIEDHFEVPGEFPVVSEQKQDIIKEILFNETGKTVAISPVEYRDRFLGFIIFSLVSTGDTLNHRDSQEIISSLCRIFIGKYYDDLEAEKLKIENQLCRRDLCKSENLKLLGEMVGSITHDMNNILTGVTGFAQLQEIISSDSDIIDSAKEIMNAASGGKNIINFLTKAKKVEFEEARQMVDIADRISESAGNIKSLARQLCPEINPDKIFSIEASEVCCMEIQPVLLEQLFLHIFLRIIKMGALKINVNLRKNNGSVQAEVDFNPDKTRKISTPILIEAENEFPDTFLIDSLADKLGFNIRILPNRILVDFPENKEKNKDRFIQTLQKSKILIFEPDSIVSEMLRIFFEMTAAEIEIIEDFQHFSSFSEDKLLKYDKIIIDPVAFGQISMLNRKDGRPEIILTSAWGKYLDGEKVIGSSIDKILLKPFTFEGLKRALTR